MTSIPAFDSIIEDIREAINVRRRKHPGVPYELLPEKPLVSVIVLNLNGETIIEKCVRCLFAQTYKNFEVLVVDNGSTDRSLEILNSLSKEHNLSILAAGRNLGVAGGRNLGIGQARGEVLAFMDNDGYADRNWLLESIRTLFSENDIGATSSVVFFNDKKLILNGVGGTMNLQGYGGDICSQEPYEFASLPFEVLYPMGCGMTIRRASWQHVGALDSALLKWFDDVEIGTRLWLSGFRVIVSEHAYVDHDYGNSDQTQRFPWTIDYTFERARIRNVIKYYPPVKIYLWAVRELWSTLRLLASSSWKRALVRCGAYLWNLIHIPTALQLRWTYRPAVKRFWHVLDKSWGQYPPPKAPNRKQKVNFEKLSPGLNMGAEEEETGLNYGFYSAETDGGVSYRNAEKHASAFLRLRKKISRVLIRYRQETGSGVVRVGIRKCGWLPYVAQHQFTSSSPSWETDAWEVDIEPGDYEMVFSCEHVHPGRRGEAVGFALNKVSFTSIP